MEHTDLAIMTSASVAQALKELGLPSPGVTQGALVYAGYQMVGGHLLTGFAIILAVCAGSMCGASVAYGAGRYLGPGLAKRIGRRLRLTTRTLDDARDRAHQGTFLAVALGRFVPAVMAPLSVAAGILRVPFSRFAGGVSLATLLWAGLFVGLGALFGRALEDVRVPTILPLVAAVVLGTILIASLTYSWWRRRRGADHHAGRPRLDGST